MLEKIGRLPCPSRRDALIYDYTAIQNRSENTSLNDEATSNYAESSYVSSSDASVSKPVLKLYISSIKVRLHDPTPTHLQVKLRKKRWLFTRSLGFRVFPTTRGWKVKDNW